MKRALRRTAVVIASIIPALVPGAAHAQDLTQVREIGVMTGPPSYTFDHIADIAVDGDGQIWVLDSGNRTVRVYAPNGRFARRIGREGTGPGEFALPVRIRIDGDTVTVTDARLFRVSRFRLDGTHLETAPLPAPAGLGLSDLRALRGGLRLGVTIFRASLGDADRHDPYVRALLLRPGSASLDTIATFQSNAAIWHVVGGKGSWGVEPTGLGSGGAIAVDGDSVVAIADGATGVVRWLVPGPDGLVGTRRAELGVRAVPVSDDDRAAASAALRARSPNLPGRIEWIMPPFHSAITGRAFFDDAHGLWVERNGDGSRGREWIRVSVAGRITCASAPSQLELRTARAGLVYGVWTDAFDVETVRVYRLREGYEGMRSCGS